MSFTAKYVMEHYCKIECLTIVLKHEPVCSIVNFLISDFLDEMSDDFTEHIEGVTVFLTKILSQGIFLKKLLPEILSMWLKQMDWL